MKRLIIALEIMFLPLLTIYSESAVFINSTPGRAEITINGVPSAQKTPALIRNLSAGNHYIEISKAGFKTFKMHIHIDDSVKILDPTLEYLYIPLLFPVNNKVQINGQLNNRDILLLKNGNYNFDLDLNMLKITPMYPGQSLINGLNISIPLLSIFSGALTVNEIYNPRNSSGTLSVFTLSSIGLNAGLIIADILLYFNRNKFYNDYSAPVVSVKSENPGSLYKTAEEMVSAGKLETALYYLKKIIAQYPDSDIYPNTLYKMAKIEIMSGDLDSAGEHLKLFTRDCPLPELYNSAEKSLSDIFERKEEFQKSLDHLKLIIFMKTGFTREEIDFQRYKILEKWFKTDPSKYKQLKFHLEHMIKTYVDSSYYYLYVDTLSKISQQNNSVKQELQY